MNAPGQSGDPEFAHCADLALLWAKGEYIPMLYSRAADESNGDVYSSSARTRNRTRPHIAESLARAIPPSLNRGVGDCASCSREAPLTLPLATSPLTSRSLGTIRATTFNNRAAFGASYWVRLV